MSNLISFQQNLHPAVLNDIPIQYLRCWGDETVFRRTPELAKTLSFDSPATAQMSGFLLTYLVNIMVEQVFVL
jgi:hypothetical protein